MNESTNANKISCKYCGSDSTKKFGTYKGQFRYFCNNCKRKFKADNTIFHGKISSTYTNQAVNDFYQGYSLIKISRKLFQQYGYRPSKSVIWKWIKKYTDLALKIFNDAVPEISVSWVADETEIDLRGLSKVWVYSVIDLETNYILASHVSAVRTIDDAEAVIFAAQKRAGKLPKNIYIWPESSFESITQFSCACNIEHRHDRVFIDENRNGNTRIERYHGIIKDEFYIISAFKFQKGFTYFNEGWVVYHNYFKPQRRLKGKTPAEAAGIIYSIKNWSELAKITT